MGEHWSWTLEQRQALTEKSLYNHSDIGCEFCNSCFKCPYEKCVEDIGRKAFKKQNGIKEEIIK